LYKGNAYIIERYDYYKDITLGYIKELEINLEKIAIIEGTTYPETTQAEIDIKTAMDVELARLESVNESLLAAVGSCSYGVFDSIIYEDYDIGKFTLFLKKFAEAKIEYDLVGTVDPDPVVFENYIDRYNEKQDFWYKLRNTYGNSLRESFYENSIETDPIQLYNESILYAYNYQQPKEEFSTTIINIGDLIGVELETLQVGEIVRLKIEDDHFLVNDSRDLQIIAIERNLRSSSDIQLQVNKFNTTEDLLEKLLIRLNN